MGHNVAHVDPLFVEVDHRRDPVQQFAHRPAGGGQPQGNRPCLLRLAGMSQDTDTRQVGAVQQEMDDLSRGEAELVDNLEVADLLNSWGTPDELDSPK